MSLKEFLAFLKKSELERILSAHDLKSTGTVDKLRERLLLAAPEGLNYTLLKGLSKERLINLAIQLNLNNRGTKEELQDRLINSIEFPEGTKRDAPIVRFSSGRVDMFDFDQSYFLYRFFSREDLQELLREADLSPTGSKDILVERYLENEKPSIRELLDEMDSQTLALVCDELGIEPSILFKAKTIKLILEEIRLLQRKQQKASPKNISEAKANENYRYDVAISFAGEDRDKAEDLNMKLKNRGIRTFYDLDHPAALFGEDLVVKLASIYGEHSKYCVIFISEHYIKKNWTNHERIHAQARQLHSEKAYILPLLVDDSKVPGLVDTLGHVDLRKYDLDFVANLISKKVLL